MKGSLTKFRRERAVSHASQMEIAVFYKSKPGPSDQLSAFDKANGSARGLDANFLAFLDHGLTQHLWRYTEQDNLPVSVSHDKGRVWMERRIVEGNFVGGVFGCTDDGFVNRADNARGFISIRERTATGGRECLGVRQLLGPDQWERTVVDLLV